MPVFYFHYWDGCLLTEDTEGSEHDDVCHAYIEAYETVEGLAIDLIRDHRSATRGRIDVVDESGRRVFHLPFSEVLARGHGTADAQQIDQLRGLRGYETARDPATAIVAAAKERPRTLGDVLNVKSDASPPEREWVALIRSIAAGDQRALHALYERSHRLVFTLIYRLVGKRQTAQRLTIEVFHDIWRSAAAYDAASGSVLGWIMNQARSRASCRGSERRSENGHSGGPDWRPLELRGVSDPQARLALRIAVESGRQPEPPPPRQWFEPRWDEVAQGIECKVFATDVERRIVSMLVRLAPGASYPPHTHAGNEELHLLDGELWIDDEKFLPGDYNYGAPGKRDERVWSETGCICVLVTSTQDTLH